MCTRYTSILINLTIFSSKILAFSFCLASFNSSSSNLRCSSSLQFNAVLAATSERLYPGGGVRLGSRSPANSTNRSCIESQNQYTWKRLKLICFKLPSAVLRNLPLFLSVVLIKCLIRQIDSHLNRSQVLLQGFQHQLATCPIIS